MRAGCCIGGQQAGGDYEPEGLLRKAGQESECLGAAEEGEGMSQVAAGTQRGGLEAASSCLSVHVIYRAVYHIFHMVGCKLLSRGVPHAMHRKHGQVTVVPHCGLVGQPKPSIDLYHLLFWMCVFQTESRTRMY